MKKLVVLASLCLVSQAYAAKWDKANLPGYFNIVAGGPMKVNLNDAPAAAKLADDRYGWSESYWPSMLGGISYRWNHPTPNPFKYKLFSKEEILKMSEAELSQLSPSELYDIAQDDYKYSLTKKVQKQYSERDLWWEGICHGWAQAASNYPEPDKTVVVNKSGVKVPFGASDVKGLLAMHEAYNGKGSYARVGARCKVVGKVPGEAFPEDGIVPFPSAKDAARPECSDVNAGTFHIVLTSMIGVYSKGFVADVDRFNDVWNQPVVGYETNLNKGKLEEFSVTPEEFRNGIARKVRVKTIMSYGDELEFETPELVSEGLLNFVSKNPVTGTSSQLTSVKNYEYILELDSFDNIVGGEWISESRPDMMWMMKADKNFRDGKFPLEGLNKIYKPVAR
jgi:hypothetical protein